MPVRMYLVMSNPYSFCSRQHAAQQGMFRATSSDRGVVFWLSTPVTARK
jgi:hypothetical protein